MSSSEGTTVACPSHGAISSSAVGGGPGTKVFKDGTGAVIQSMYYGEGPPEKYQTNGSIDVLEYSTGQPKTDANVIVCTHVQVVYSGVNLTTPSTCAQTVF